MSVIGSPTRGLREASYPLIRVSRTRCQLREQAGVAFGSARRRAMARLGMHVFLNESGPMIDMLAWIEKHVICCRPSRDTANIHGQGVQGSFDRLWDGSDRGTAKRRARAGPTSRRREMNGVGSIRGTARRTALMSGSITRAGVDERSAARQDVEGGRLCVARDGRSSTAAAEDGTGRRRKHRVTRGRGEAGHAAGGGAGWRPSQLSGLQSGRFDIAGRDVHDIHCVPWISWKLLNKVTSHER